MRLAKVTCVLLAGWLAADCPAAVRTGLDNIGMHQELFQGKRVGIIANHTSYSSTGQYIVDMLRGMEGVRVVALFSPEHGLRGTEEAGKEVGNEVDPNWGLPVYSLYGPTKKPTPQMLAEVDVLVFDMQDVGARFYTYLYTMALSMEAAAECGKRFVVLDRPNPINGVQVEGKVLEPSCTSFVGLYPVPVRYGMTIGEFARMVNGEGWLANHVKADLTVVPLTGWRRDMWFDQTGLRPWIDPNALAAKLNSLTLPGLRFAPTSFVPTSSKFQGQRCFGVEITVTDRTRLEPFWTGVQIINELHRLYPGKLAWHAAHFDHLCGTSTIREAITTNKPLSPLRAAWTAECKTFDQTRRKYLLYDGETSEQQEPGLLKVEQFALAEGKLSLTYRVNNIFPQDIWVCEDVDQGYNYHKIEPTVDTRITDDTLHIKLLGNIKSNKHTEGEHWIRYHRLAPQEARSGTILLPLPVRNQSRVFSTEPFTGRKERLTLRRILFQVGFFKEDLLSLLLQTEEKGWLSTEVRMPPKPKDPDIAIVPYRWKGIRLLEQAAQVAIADVNVPGLVIVLREKDRLK